MKSHWPIAIVALFALAAFAVMPAGAAEDYTFTVVLTDDADDQSAGAGGYYDIREVAIGEPGDDTMI